MPGFGTATVQAVNTAVDRMLHPTPSHKYVVLAVGDSFYGNGYLVLFNTCGKLLYM
jgi:hypothetical protein